MQGSTENPGSSTMIGKVPRTYFHMYVDLEGADCGNRSFFP